MAGNLISAISEYEKLFPRYRNDRTVVYNYACVLSRAGRRDSSLSYLRKAVRTDPSLSVLADPHLLSLRDMNDWKLFEDELIAAVNARIDNSIKDPGYAKSLLRLLCLDRTGFYEMNIAVSTFGPVSPVVTAIRRLHTLQNEKNIQELQLLLGSKGWPERSQVGAMAASSAFFVVQHSDAQTQEKYMGMFEAACRKGEGNWQQYALMFDRMRMNQDKPQRFGTHSYLDPSKGKTDELYPLEDASKVDEWRKEIGLEPLKEYLARTGIKYVPQKAAGK
ncbi:MAG: hypothetical protein MUD02_06105 [Bacteroidales bacterium]|nr:hypothetical protein [Bacteroidales bacterium]